MNNLLLTLVLLIMSNGIFAQASDFTKEPQKSKSEIHTPFKHKLGLSVTTLGPLELNYEYQFSKRTRFRTSFAPISFGENEFSYKFNAGTRTHLLTLGRMQLYTGLEYSYLDFKSERFFAPDNYRFQRHSLEMPVGVRFNLGKRHVLDFSTFSSLILKEARSDDPFHSPGKRFLPFNSIKVGYQFKF